MTQSLAYVIIASAIFTSTSDRDVAKRARTTRAVFKKGTGCTLKEDADCSHPRVLRHTRAVEWGHVARWVVHVAPDAQGRWFLCLFVAVLWCVVDR